MKNYNKTYKTKDKQIVPFLLTQQEINLVGTEEERGILYFNFSPQDKCISLVNSFINKNAPFVQAKDLLEAVETFRDMVFQMKEKKRYGGYKT